MEIPSEQLFRIQSAAALCLDTAKAYEKAAEKANDDELQNFFEKISRRRNNLFLGLKSLLESTGKDMDMIEGTTTGQLQRFWMEMENDFTHEQRAVLIKEMDRSEGMLMEKIQEIKDHNKLPENIKAMIESLEKSVADTESKLKNLSA